MKIHIKNMVSNRCITAVKEELKKLGLHYIIIVGTEKRKMKNTNTLIFNTHF